MKHSVIGMDIARRVFQLHSVAADTGEIERIKLRRDEVLPFFAQHLLAGSNRSLRQCPLVGQAASSPGSRGQAARCQVGAPIRALQQDRCG